MSFGVQKSTSASINTDENVITSESNVLEVDDEHQFEDQHLSLSLSPQLEESELTAYHYKVPSMLILLLMTTSHPMMLK